MPRRLVASVLLCDAFLFVDSLVQHNLFAGRGRVEEFAEFLLVLIILHVLRHECISLKFGEVAN